MKKIISVFALLISFYQFSNAQVDKRTSAIISYNHGGELNDAKLNIDAASQDAVTGIDPKTWTYYGKIYLSIFYDSGRSSNKVANALELATTGFMKAQSYDVKKKWSDDIEAGLGDIYGKNYNAAIPCYMKGKFDSAYLFFKNANEINIFLNKNYNEPLDSASNIGYLTAFTAFRSGNLDAAKSLYSTLIGNGLEKDDAAFRNLFELYLDQKDTVNALAIIQNGEKRFPNSEALLIDEINLLIANNKTQQAVDKLSSAITAHPDSLKYYYILGEKYEELNQMDKATTIYNQLITGLQSRIQKSGGKSIDYGTLGSAYERLKRYPDAADAFAKAIANSKTDDERADYNFKTGAMYFNQAVVLDKKREDIKNITPEEDKKMNDQITAFFNQAMPFLETARKLNPKDMQTLDALKQLYGTLNMVDKYNEVKKAIEDLKKG